MHNIVDHLARARRIVQKTHGVPALYSDDVVSVPVEIMARWHNKIDRFGDPQTLGFAEIIQGIDRIVLVPGDTPDIQFKRLGRIEFPALGNAFILQVKEPSDGPLQEVWQAVLA